MVTTGFLGFRPFSKRTQILWSTIVGLGPLYTLERNEICRNGAGERFVSQKRCGLLASIGVSLVVQVQIGHCDSVLKQVVEKSRWVDRTLAIIECE